MAIRTPSVLSPLGEPLCWGMHGLPLLPPQLEQFFHSHYATPVQSGRRSRGTPTASPLSQYCTVPWTIPVSLGLAPSDYIDHEVTLLVLTSEDDRRLDVPLCDVRLEQIHDLEDLPYLTTTWSAIERASLDTDRLAALVHAGSFADAVRILNSVSAAIDLSITTQNWISPTGRVIRALEPHSVESAFEVIRCRHALQGSPVAFTGLSELERVSIITSRAFDGLLNINGTKETLESLSRPMHVTRERVRQLETKHLLKHPITRRWPLGDTLTDLESIVSTAVEEGASDLDHVLRSLWPEFGLRPTVAASNLLTAFGRNVGRFDSSGVLIDPRAEGFPFTEGKIRRIARDLSGPSGFIRRPDLVEELVGHEPNVDPDLLSIRIDEAASVFDLPDEYLYFSSSKRSQFEGIAHRILARNNPLSIEVMRSGFERAAIFRKWGSLPPNDVLLATLRQIADFIVEDDLVESLTPELPDPGTLREWIMKQLDDSGVDCMTRTHLLQNARDADLNPTSVSLFLSFGEQFVRLPRGCIGIVGNTPPPEFMEIAAQRSRLIQLKSHTQWRSTPRAFVARVTVGNNFRDSGVLGIRTQLRDVIGDDRFPIYSELGQHGHTGTQGAMAFGFVGAMNALDVAVGDTITIEFDFVDRVARVSVGDYIPSDPDPASDDPDVIGE